MCITAAHNSVTKQAENLTEFTKDTQVANKHMKTSNIIVLRKPQVKTN